MSIANPIQTREMQAQGRWLTAWHFALLVSSQHGVATRPDDLPLLADDDMTSGVSAALINAGFRTRVIEDCNWDTAAELARPIRS